VGRSRTSVILASLLVAGVVVTTILLGQWQLRRHREVREVDARIEARLEEPAVALSDLPGLSDADDHRLITTTGTWDVVNEVVIRNRSRNGVNGNLVVTPLLVDDGTALLVARGWVPPDHDVAPITAATPPAGVVTVTARLRHSEPQPGFGATDPGTDQPTELRAFFNLDVTLIGNHLDLDVLALWASLETQQPTTDDTVLRALDPVELTGGPHLSYAFQWFGIAVAALGSFGAWLWRGRRQVGERDHVAA